MNKEVALAIARYAACLGFASGATLSGLKKFVEIMDESPYDYKQPLIEVPIRGVLHSSRIAGHVAIGGTIGMAVALTAPISIPAYWYWSTR